MHPEGKVLGAGSRPGRPTIPILIVTGSHDAIFASEMMRLLDAELPTSRLVAVPDTGRSSYFERPDTWSRAVTEHPDGCQRFAWRADPG